MNEKIKEKIVGVGLSILLLIALTISMARLLPMINRQPEFKVQVFSSYQYQSRYDNSTNTMPQRFECWFNEPKEDYLRFCKAIILNFSNYDFVDELGTKEMWLGS